MAHAASHRLTPCTSLDSTAVLGAAVRQALHCSIVFIICPMNGVDWHFIVLIGGDGAGCVPASRLLSLGGGGDHCPLPSASLSLSQGSMAGAGSLPCGDGLVLQLPSAG